MRRGVNVDENQLLEGTGVASTTGWLTATEAAARLGVKAATLYAYVSRGVLVRRRSPDGHSLFDPAEIERLARRGRPRRASGAAELVIESRLTELGDDRPFFRGRDALRLAGSHDLEDVALWLWTGDPAVLVDGPARTPWQAPPAAVAAGRAAQSGLPSDVLPLERLQVIAPALAATDPLRHNPEPTAVAHVGRTLIAGMVDCLPGESAEAGVTGRLWAKLAPAGVARPAPPGLVDALRVALVLLADHELAASTLAARVAASVRADPYAAVIAGLGAMAGALHGGASLSAEAMLAEASDPAQARQIVGARLRRGERIPGFGHMVYRVNDGRAGLLLDRVRAAAPDHPRLAVAEAVIDEAARRRLPGVNVEFALAVLADVSGMTSGAGEAIFAIARTAGWLAHAMEEYAQPTPLRLRAVYIGPPPDR
jgi:citrate synthase